MKRLTLFGLLIAIVGVLAPIVWDYYTGQRAIEVKILSSISILEEDPILEELTVSFKNKVVKNLTKINFALINSGRRPIADEEVKTFPTINFGKKTEVLLATITRTDPKNINCSIVENVESGSISVHFDLINPSDVIEFNVYISGLFADSPLINSRIKGIKHIDVIDKTLEQVTPTKKIGLSVYIVAPVIFLFTIILPYMLKEFNTHRNSRKLLRNNPELLRGVDSILEFEEFIGNNLTYVNSEEQTKLREILDDDDSDFANKKAKLIGQITRLIQRASGAESGFYLSIVIIIMGAGFLYWKLIY